jgi:hypothetical protein
MTQASCVPLEKKSFSRSSISARVLDDEIISAARSGAPGRNFRVEGVNPRRCSRSFGMNEMSGARQLRFCIQQPRFDPSTTPRRRDWLKFASAVSNRMQMLSCSKLFLGLIASSPFTNSIL